MVIARTAVDLAQIRKLLYAVRTFDYDQIQRLLSKGIDGIINYNDPTSGDTPLLVAVQNNDEKMMQFLLDRGANPDGTDFQRRTPLIRAAEYGFVEGIQVLLNIHADMTIRDVNGHDVLFACLSDGTYRQQQCFSMLMAEQTSNVHSVSNTGKHLLIAACEKGPACEKMCLALIERGADVNASDRDTGKTALHAACTAGSVVVARELLTRGANSNARDLQQQTPAHAAVTSKVFELLPILSAYNARFDLADRELNTPIHLAAQFNQGQAIKFMVQRGGSTKTKNASNQSPMKVATLHKSKEAKKAIRLAEKKRYARPISSPKSNPNRDFRLHFYDWIQERSNRLLRRFHEVENVDTHRISSNDLKRIIGEECFTQITPEDLNDIIIKHETNPNEIDYQTFLSGKLFVEKPFLLSVFLSTKAKNKKKRKKNKKNKTSKQVPIPIAIQTEGPRTAHGNPPMVYVKQHQFITDRNRFDRDRVPKHIFEDDSAHYLDQVQPQFIHIHNAAHRGDLLTLNDAFKAGVPVNIRDKFYKTPLMIAAATGDLETVQFLLQCGANVNLEDHFKWTALHHAANSGQLSVVRSLVEAGAKINHPSVTLATPLSRAIESSSSDIVQYLIEKRADVRHENLTQRNLLDLATDFATPEVYNIVRTAYEQKTKKKGNQQPKKRRPSTGNKMKKKQTNMAPVALKPVKIEAPLPRRHSLLIAERKLLSSDDISQPITYRLRNEWTNQPMTKELLEKKVHLRNAFTMSIDFPNYKPPLLANAQAKLERVEPSGSTKKKR